MTPKDGSIDQPGDSHCVHCQKSFDAGDDPDHYTCRECRSGGHGFKDGQCRICRLAFQNQVKAIDRSGPWPSVRPDDLPRIRKRKIIDDDSLGIKLKFDPPDPPMAA